MYEKLINSAFIRVYDTVNNGGKDDLTTLPVDILLRFANASIHVLRNLRQSTNGEIS